MADNREAVVIPSLCEILNITPAASRQDDLLHALARINAPQTICAAAKAEVGFTDFYAPFRNTSWNWMTTHATKIRPLMVAARRLKSDSSASSLYDLISQLPPIPRKVGGPLPAANLLTPLVACLDPRARAPIINSAKSVTLALKQLGLFHATLSEKFSGLVGLIGQAGIEDAFFLDVCLDLLGKTVLGKAVDPIDSQKAEKLTQEPPKKDGANSAPLGLKDAEDLKVISLGGTKKRAQLHNKMTNRLLALCKKHKLTVDEGSDKACRYDARIQNYAKGRDLLIEAKTSTEIADSRLAVGQLLDYRRHLAKRASTDIAVLLPQRPDSKVMNFLDDVGVKLIWFKEDFKSITGEIEL
ncbi:hypothetical protein [Cystobacter fuscus]|uniref:hypothetical protein n=1 Tax=Cystobacter fuscus TaxID=43 RepID=UPI0012FD2B70|nr:hypothetical protein [Cystobacter fuscus]